MSASRSAGPTDIRVIPFTKEHARDVARLHREGITTGFLSTLGDGFLAALYEGIAASPRSMVLVAESEHAVEHDAVPRSPLAGFIAGTLDTRRMYRWIVPRYGARFLVRLAPKAFDGRVRRKIIETFFYAKAARASPSQRSPELLAIAVDKQARGRGIGGMLIDALETRFAANGAGEYTVVTFAPDAASNGFYRAHGFTLARHFRHHGNEMHEYVKRLIS